MLSPPSLLQPTPTSFQKENPDQGGVLYCSFASMREKTSVPDDQFRKYLDLLLDNKDHEKVLEMMSKVNKTIKTSEPICTTWKGRGSSCRQVQCYNCSQFGHYQSIRPSRHRADRGSLRPLLRDEGFWRDSRRIPNNSRPLSIVLA